MPEIDRPYSMCKYCNYSLVISEYEKYASDLHNNDVCLVFGSTSDIYSMLNYSCPMCIIWWWTTNFYICKDEKLSSKFSQYCDLIVRIERLICLQYKPSRIIPSFFKEPTVPGLISLINSNCLSHKYYLTESEAVIFQKAGVSVNGHNYGIQIVNSHFFDDIAWLYDYE